MAKQFDAIHNGRYVRIAAVYNYPPHRWAWLVDVNNPAIQYRLSLNHEAFDHLPSLRNLDVRKK